jgi:hypothetical protein
MLPKDYMYYGQSAIDLAQGLMKRWKTREHDLNASPVHASRGTKMLNLYADN